MKILYITFIDFGDYTSGSRVRPQKMYQAFIAEGHDVKLLEGQQNRFNQRKKRVRDIITWLETTKPDICYIEPPAGPFFNLIDIKLIKKIYKSNIPIGIFYRDCYWMLDDWMSNQKIKRAILIAMHKRDLKFFQKYCDTVYFPSQTMADLFDFRVKKLLPPASEGGKSKLKTITKTAIYVGGIDARSGAELLFDTFRLLNKNKINVRLIIVTRKECLKNIPADLLICDWLDVHSTSGDDKLEILYNKSDLAIVPYEPGFYMDLTIPVKLFEYLGYQKPVIVNKCKEIAKFVDQYNLGLVCASSPEAMADTINMYYASEDIQQKCYIGIEKALSENQWKNRVCQIVNDLYQVKRQ